MFWPFQPFFCIRFVAGRESRRTATANIWFKGEGIVSPLLLSIESPKQQWSNTCHQKVVSSVPRLWSKSGSLWWTDGSQARHLLAWQWPTDQMKEEQGVAVRESLSLMKLRSHSRRAPSKNLLLHRKLQGQNEPLQTLHPLYNSPQIQSRSHRRRGQKQRHIAFGKISVCFLLSTSSCLHGRRSCSFKSDSLLLSFDYMYT